MHACSTLRYCGDNSFYLYEYIPWKDTEKRNEITKLMLDFKNDNLSAINTVQRELIQAFTPLVPYFRDTLQCNYIVTVPSSQQGALNKPCEKVCEALMEAFPWLIFLEGSLERTQTVTKSSRAEVGMRPGYSDHMRSIRYAGPRLNLANESYILLDDVLTRGATSKACRDILTRATNCKQVAGLFVGKTVSQWTN